MRELQVEEFVRPIPMEFREGKGNRKRVPWCMPVDTSLQWNANQLLKLPVNEFRFDRLCEAHVIMVGDHGQGAMRMMASLLFLTRQDRRCPTSPVNFYIGTELALEVDGLCGYTQCQKDTHNILKATIADPIDDSLVNIRNAKTVTLHRDADDIVKMCWGKQHTNVDQIVTEDVRIFMTGDLAFYLLMLGKEHMAGHWCWRCPMSKQEWTSTDGPRVHDSWTLESLSSHHAQLESGELNKKKSEQVKGVTRKALTTCAEPKNVLAPPLHGNELFVNHPINKGLMAWMHHRIKKLPLELIEARLAHVDLIVEMQDLAAQLRVAKQEVSVLAEESKTLKPQRRRRRKDNGDSVPPLVFRDQEHQQSWNDNQRLLEEAKDQVIELECLCIDLGKDKKSMEQKTTRIRKKKEHGALSQEIRQRIEQMLEQSDLDRERLAAILKSHHLKLPQS